VQNTYLNLKTVARNGSCTVWPKNHQRCQLPPSCPGGIGNYGFNSYDLLTFSILVMGAVSSAVIVNTNKNENNDNNNDLQASFGDINTNNQMASADQTSTNMAMIISPPAGPPVVIPLGGRMLRNGTIALQSETSIPGVSWESEQFHVYDNNTVLDKASRRRQKGVVAFGTIDERNVFNLLPYDLNWDDLRRGNGNKLARSAQLSPPVISFKNDPVFVPTEIVNELFEKSVLKDGLTLVQIVLPTTGPPIVIAIGAVLKDGSVYPNDGIEVEGAFFESTDRTLYENGTIVYKLTNTTELGKVTYALIDQEGNLDYLPRLGSTPTSMNLFRRLNVKPASRKLNIKLIDLNINDDDWSSIRDSASKAIRDNNGRKKREVTKISKKNGLMRHALSLTHLVKIFDFSNHDAIIDILCLASQKVHDSETRVAVSTFKPKYICFYDNIVQYCNAHLNKKI